MIVILCLLRHALSKCKLKFSVSGQIPNPKGIRCFDSVTHRYNLTGYNCQTEDEFDSPTYCSYYGDGCDGHTFEEIWPNCVDNAPYEIQIDKSDIPYYCFSKNPYAIISNEVDIEGFEVILFDSYNDSFVPITGKSQIVIDHPERFYLEVYFKSDLCKLNESYLSYPAYEKGNSFTVEQSDFLEYCEPLRIRFVYNFPDNYYFYYEINSNNNIQNLESNNVYVFGYLFNMSVYVSNEYNGEKLKIDKIFTGRPKIQNYELTEMDIPEKYRTYKVEITNNINEAGYDIYAKIIGDEKYNKIESGKTYSHSDTKKYVVEIYKILEGSTEYVYCKAIPSSLTPNSITLTDFCDAFIEYCNITIKNDLYPGYKIIAEDSLHHEKIIIQANETVTIERKEKFRVNITYQMDACFSGYAYGQLNSEYTNYQEYTKQNIPNNCKPYYAQFEINEPNKYKFYYTIDYEDDSVLHDLTNETIYSGCYFSLTLYVTSNNGKCNKQVLEDEFRGNGITYDIVNYIPKKCQNVLYKVIISFDEHQRPDDCIIHYTTSLNSTMITTNETINISSEENFELYLFMTYKYCSNYYIYSYQADPFAQTSEYGFYHLPDVCEKENQIYQVLINISDLPPEYSIEYQTLNYSKNEYGPSTKANELINITKNEVFGVKVLLTSSPGCSNSFLFEIKVDDALPIENITINDIPLKCRMEGVVTDSLRENDIFDVRFEYDAKSTSKEIREEIKSLFNDNLLWENDPNKDKVIEIQGLRDTPLKFNMNLEDNEYISIKGDKDISYENGNLNLFLDSEYVTINVPEKVDLKVKGGGCLTFESEYDEVNVSSQFIINKDFKLRTYDVKRLNLDSIDIYENVVMSKDIYGNNCKINIKNVNVKPGANVSMDNINSIDNLVINQPGRLIRDGSFENSSIVFNLKSNIDLFPMLQGSLKNHPKSISITNNAGDPKINQEITLISGEYSDFRCYDWKEALDLEGSGYNFKECITKSDSRFLSSSTTLIIKKIEKNGDGGKDSNKNGLEPGVIAAIVIVVVVVVAAVIVVVVIVIRKKKNRENSESQAGENAEDI